MWALMHFSTPWKHDLPICFSKPLVCTSLRPRNRCMNFKPLYRKTIPWNHLFNGPQLTPESLEGIENLNMFRHNLKHFDLSQFEYCDKELLLTAVYCKPTLFCSIVLELERGLHFFSALDIFYRRVSVKIYGMHLGSSASSGNNFTVNLIARHVLIVRPSRCFPFTD